MDIRIVAYTKFLPGVAAEITGGRWIAEPGAGDAASLAEFAGRLCYDAFGRKNPATATNEGYLRNIFSQEHLSVIEHGSVSFWFGGVSRSLTHELIRHRHLSFSQLSQRYLPPTREAVHVMPELLRGDDEAENELWVAWRHAVDHYDRVLVMAQRRAEAAGYSGHIAKKRALEAARSVLPNMTPTNILVTGNHRAWIECLLKRGAGAADLEIRKAAFEVFGQLRALEPNLYQGIKVVLPRDDQAPDAWLEAGWRGCDC